MYGGKSERHFRVVQLDGKKVELGGVSITSKASPGSAARKLLTSIAHEKGLKKNKKASMPKVKFCIQEYTQGSSKKVYGPYVGHFHKYTAAELKKAATAKGKVKFTMKPVVKLAKRKNNMKGGDGSNGNGSNNSRNSINSNFEFLVPTTLNNPPNRLQRSNGQIITENEIGSNGHLFLEYILDNEIFKNLEIYLKNKLGNEHSSATSQMNHQQIINQSQEIISQMNNKQIMNQSQEIISKMNKNNSNKQYGVVFYKKTKEDHKTYNFSSFFTKNASHNLKIIILKPDEDYINNLVNFVDKNMTSSTGGKCLTKLRLILGKKNNRKAYCLPNNEEFITKYTGKNKNVLEVGDFVELNGNDWTKVELPVSSKIIQNAGGSGSSPAVNSLLNIGVLLYRLHGTNKKKSSISLLKLTYLYLVATFRGKEKFTKDLSKGKYI